MTRCPPFWGRPQPIRQCRPRVSHSPSHSPTHPSAHSSSFLSSPSRTLSFSHSVAIALLFLATFLFVFPFSQLRQCFTYTLASLIVSLPCQLDAIVLVMHVSRWAAHGRDRKRQSRRTSMQALNSNEYSNLSCQLWTSLNENESVPNGLDRRSMSMARSISCTSSRQKIWIPDPAPPGSQFPFHQQCLDLC